MRALTHTFIEYYDTEGKGYPPIRGTLSYNDQQGQEYTRPAPAETRPGDRIFVVIGLGKPKKYLLWEEFVVDHVDGSADERRAHGRGWQLVPPRPFSVPGSEGFQDPVAGNRSFVTADGPDFKAALESALGSGRALGDDAADAFFTDLIDQHPESGYFYACRSYVRRKLRR
jgi:hypothetical protein